LWLRGGYRFSPAFGSREKRRTLISLLLARRKQGGLLAGRAVQAGKTAVISEEDEDIP
jgi:hypothetical protein